MWHLYLHGYVTAVFSSQICIKSYTSCIDCMWQISPISNLSLHGLHQSTHVTIQSNSAYQKFDTQFRGLCIVIYSYNKTNQIHKFLEFIFGIELYMFWTVSLSIIKSFSLYIEQQVYVMQVVLTTCYQAVSITCMTYTCCCVYSTRLLMMDIETV